MIRLVTPGVLPFTSSWRGLIAVASAISPKPMEIRSKGKALLTIMDSPTVRVRSLGALWSKWTEGSAAGAGALSVCWPVAVFTKDNASRHAGLISAAPDQRALLTAVLRAG
jgi:hypothetical protein